MATSAALVFAGKSVAASAISFLINKAFNYLDDYRKSEGMEEVKNRLLLAMPKIQAVFHVVNPEHIKEQSSALEAWLWQFRDAFEEAEDAIDELEYYELEEKAKDRKVSDSGSSFAKVKRKAVKHVKHISILDKTVKSLTHHGTVKRLRKALGGLDRAAAGVADFLALAGHLKEEYFLNRDRETGSTITATEVFGRHEEKELVVRWLTKKLDEDAEIVVSTTRPSVISIVGHGGMGKTILAQLIYQDGGVTNHFDKVIWACISTSFDATTVITKILDAATWPQPNANTYEASQKILREKLNSVKFLLILDDVWEDKKDGQWGKLFAPLRTGKRGSKVLLTTRMQSVADLAAEVMGGEQECLALQGLEKEDNIKLFKHHAFSRLNLQDNADLQALQAIGEEIATKLRGYPLVTKVVGAHLRGSTTFEYWNYFLHQGLEQFDGNAEDIMKVLKLSYYHLPTELQTCFRYCSIFPQDYEFEKEELLHMWMSSGLISQDAGGAERLPYIGEQYLVQLTGKSFFDLRFRKQYPGVNIIHEEPGYYVMHDLMHDLAKYVSSGECAEIVDVASLENVARTVRHVSVQDITSFPVEEIKKISHLKNLRTIFIRHGGHVVKEDILSTVEEVVHSSNSLRIVSTDLFHTSHFLSKHAKLKHLRYYKSNSISPESICGIVKLYHLTVLSCYFPKKVREQVKDIGNLDRLRYVSFGEAYIPVGRLASLRALYDYEVQRAEGYKISALKDLRGLRHLGLWGLENVANHEEAKDAKLKEKQYLNSLSLEWSGCNGAQSPEEAELILEQLEPNANIKRLRISGYNGTRLPNWVAKPSVKHLVKLVISDCTNLEQLPPLAEFLMLKHLWLLRLPRLEKIGQPLNVYGNGCIESSLPPPSLCTLEVSYCPELRKFPLLPPSLVSVEIKMVGLIKLPRIDKPCSESTETKPSQLLHIRVEDCACLTSLEGSLLEQTQYMGALRALYIASCIQLESVSLPFEEMNGLTELTICSCPNLRTLRDAGDKVLPSSLAELTVWQCGFLELPLQGLTNLSELVLFDCSDLASLPCADVFKRLESLKGIEIIECKNLSSLGGLGALPLRVDHLTIRRCSKLAEVGSSHQIPHASGGKEEHLVVPSSPLQIRRLLIDLPSLLLVEPLKNLCHTQRLTIEDGSEMESFLEFWLQQNRTSLTYLQIRNAKSLESLPLPLSSLEELFLYDDAGRLRSLPDLPSSLQRLRIWGCDSELEKKSREYGGPVWNKISHIPRVKIGDVYFIMGKECSEETFSDCLNSQDMGFFCRNYLAM